MVSEDEILLGDVLTVVRIGPPPDTPGVVAPYAPGETLFSRELVRHTVAARHGSGARFRVQPASVPLPPGHETLFVVRRDGRPDPATEGGTLTAGQGDTLVLLEPAPAPDN
ncbi:hypothetical protein [Streptomyces djakartensis]|uniref:hypothetical protein n=1 Tax=Streptomyces djakartensis TaxID=68193 RepID=UPI0034DFEFF3